MPRRRKAWSWAKRNYKWLVTGVLVPLLVALAYYMGTRKADAGVEQTKLNAWTEGVKELKSLFPALLSASAGQRPLVSQPNFKQFDDLRLLCKPFVSEPSQRIHYYLVQMAQCARFMENRCPAVQNEYTTCWPLAEQLAERELRYPPASKESLRTLVRAFRDYLVPSDYVAELTGLAQTGDSALILYVGSDTGLLPVIQSAVRRPHVTHNANLHAPDLQGYDAVVVNGGVDSLDIARLKTLVSQGCGLVLVGRTPSLLTGGNRYLGRIEDWFGADFILDDWGSRVTPAARRVLDRDWDARTTLPGPPSWRGGVSALSPAGLGARTVVLAWCSEDIGVFSAAVLPDSAHPGRVYYQGGLGEQRYPELESMFVSGVRWAAGLLQ